jgi:type 1 glutamine amidotransferase
MRTLLAVLAFCVAAPTQDKPRLLIITGANNHDWKATTPYLKQVLEKGGLAVDIEEDPDAPVLSDPAKLASYQALVLNLNRNARWTPEREANFLDYVKKGGGLVVVHAADNAFPGWDEYDKLVGGTWRSKGTIYPERGTYHPAYSEFEVQVIDEEHPITRGIKSFKTTDEMYTNLKLQENIRVLAQGSQSAVSKPQPMLFVSEYGRGKMFQTALGHDLKAMQTPEFVETLVRGARWAATTGK